MVIGVSEVGLEIVGDTDIILGLQFCKIWSSNLYCYYSLPEFGHREEMRDRHLWMQLPGHSHVEFTESILPIQTLKVCRYMSRIKPSNGKMLET